MIGSPRLLTSGYGACVLYKRYVRSTPSSADPIKGATSRDSGLVYVYIHLSLSLYIYIYVHIYVYTTTTTTTTTNNNNYNNKHNNIVWSTANMCIYMYIIVLLLFRD